MRSGKNLKYQLINKSKWLGEKSPSLFLTKGNFMTFYHGLGMFIFNMGALLVGAIIAYIIINDLEKKRKHKEYLEKLFGKKWKQDDDTN
jgi:ABC-type polysaccharide transport system permease subunit